MATLYYKYKVVIIFYMDFYHFISTLKFMKNVLKNQYIFIYKKIVDNVMVTFYNLIKEQVKRFSKTVL